MPSRFSRNLENFFGHQHPTLYDKKPFEGNSEAGFDAISLEFEINADKYQEIADTCCERLLLTGSKDLDGIYYKSDRVMNGKAAYATRETDQKEINN